MSSKQKWRICIEDLETRVRVGIHPHEREPQRILVNAHIEAEYDRHPQAIEDCYNYENLYRLVMKEWPSRPHIPLLEIYVDEALDYIFSTDARTTWAKVSVHKPDVFPEAKSVGVEAERTREEYLRHSPR